MFPHAKPKEQRAFQYFMDNTAHELTGYFSTQLWQQRVPQLSFSNSALWHIVVAMSSIHEGFALGIQDSQEDAQLASYSLASRHYSLAVKKLTEAISTQPDNLEFVLLCCKNPVSITAEA
jgi:hypothetical protein